MASYSQSAILNEFDHEQIAPYIDDLIHEFKDRPWVSFEFFPPKTETGINNLYNRIETLQERGPLFIDFTWGAGGSTSDLTLELTKKSQDRFGCVGNMHLTCTNMSLEKLRVALECADKSGIKNILALRGDPPLGEKNFTVLETGFECALDLIQFIQKDFKNKFCISVAGYPEGHPDRIREVLPGLSLTPSERARCSTLEDGSIHVCSDREFEMELEYLKAKVDNGASFIVTQMFFDIKVFLSFVDQCRQYGITVPIIPGIICFNSYDGFKRMLEFCKTRLPEGMSEDLRKIKDDSVLVTQYVVQWGIDICESLLSHGHKGLHFYTLNADKIVSPILDGLGL